MIKRIIIIFLLLIMPPCFADDVKTRAFIVNGFNIQNPSKTIEFITTEPIAIGPEIIIPDGTTVQAEFVQSQKERRWHKSGFFICKLTSYTIENNPPVNITNLNLYFIARKYEAIDKGEATMVGTELALSSAAAVFIPGVDIAYYFTKGAIQRKKHDNWFKAGVSNAYDNSICWFFLKGKPIELNEGDLISLKEIDEADAKMLDLKIQKRKQKEYRKEQMKELKQAHKRQIEELETAAAAVKITE